MIPGPRADEVLDDLALDIDEGGDLLRILPLQMGQQPLEVEVHVAPAGLGLQSMLIGYDELAQTLHHLREDVRGDETIAQDFLSPLGPHGVHLFASSHGSVNTGCCVEAMVIPMMSRALSQTTENRKVEARKPLIFRDPIFRIFPPKLNFATE